MYYVLFSFYLLLVMVPIKNKNRRIIISTIPLIIFGFVRYGVGADYFLYEQSYNSIVNRIPLENEYFLAITNGLIINFVQTIGGFGISYQMAVGTLTMVTVGLFSYIIGKKSENLSLSYLLFYSAFYFVWSISNLRQGFVLAVMSVLLFSGLDTHRFIKMIIIGFLALIHISALIMIPYLLVEPFKLNINLHLKIFIGSIIFSFIPWYSIISSISFYGSDVVLRYLNPNASFFMFFKIARIILFVTIYIHYERLSENVYYKQITDIYLFGLSLFFIMSPSEILAGRYAIYSYISMVLLLPKISSYYEFNSRIAVVSLIVVFSSMYFYKELITMRDQTQMVSGSYVPMTTIFDKNRVEFLVDYNFNEARIK